MFDHHLVYFSALSINASPSFKHSVSKLSDLELEEFLCTATVIEIEIEITKIQLSKHRSKKIQFNNADRFENL